MMERLRSMSQASSHKMKLESVPASPEPILRDTAFTPTADQVGLSFLLPIKKTESKGPLPPV
jgi:hypothetical protein